MALYCRPAQFSASPLLWKPKGEGNKCSLRASAAPDPQSLAPSSRSSHLAHPAQTPGTHAVLHARSQLNPLSHLSGHPAPKPTHIPHILQNTQSGSPVLGAVCTAVRGDLTTGTQEASSKFGLCLSFFHLQNGHSNGTPQLGLGRIK